MGENDTAHKHAGRSLSMFEGQAEGFSYERQPGDQFLSSSAMDISSRSIALLAYVLHFPILELWWCQRPIDNSDPEYKCLYTHAEDQLTKQYPGLITGHYPLRSKEHTVSPSLCKIVLESENGFYWKVNREYILTNNQYPVKTELAYKIPDITGTYDVVVVGLSSFALSLPDAKRNYLTSLSRAIYIAAFDFDSGQAYPLDDDSQRELDVKAHLPSNLISITPKSSMADLTSVLSKTQTQDGNEGKEEDIGLSIEPRNRNVSTVSELSESVHSAILKSHESEEIPALIGTGVPTWEPMQFFNFPVAEIEVKYKICLNMQLNMFSDVMHIADGSNANIYSAKYKNSKVIIKMIKSAVANDGIACHEFDIEFGTLCRVDHKNIIKVIGSGEIPRKFLVLEYLEGGSLYQLLCKHQSKPTFTQRIFRQPTFTYSTLLMRAKQIAEALNYLHTFHPGATVIHRDIKPDNVGFTSDGCLKLFDFGLVTCVNSIKPGDSYSMTGNTGSLRYMAPEVASREPYTEKVDVYSFGIMLWQMARDKLPFNGLSKAEFYKHVVHGNGRPKLDKNWPSSFRTLLSSCWDKNDRLRPSFSEIITILNTLIAESSSSKGKLKQKEYVEAQSSWF